MATPQVPQIFPPHRRRLARRRADPGEASYILDDMVDEQGKPLPYSDDLRDQLLELPYMRLGLLRGYQSAMIGAKAGN